MPTSFNRKAGYTVVIAGFLSLAFGLTTLSAVLDFFSLDGAPASEIATFLQTHVGLLDLALISTLVGYLLAVPMMLMITEATFVGLTDRSRSRHVALGLVWASLPLRPLWWAGVITLMPSLLAASEQGTDQATATATFVGYQMLYTVLNTATEDIAINILGGSWFVLVGLTIASTRKLPAVLGWIGVVIGVFYIVSAAEVFGLSLASSLGIIQLVVSVAGPFWLGIAGMVAVRKLR
jgi:hypothetical protein